MHCAALYCAALHCTACGEEGLLTRVVILFMRRSRRRRGRRLRVVSSDGDDGVVDGENADETDSCLEIPTIYSDGIYLILD